MSVFKFLTIPLIFFASNVEAKTPYVSKTQTLITEGSELGANLEVFMPTIHSDPDGTLVEFDQFETYRHYDLNLFGSYGFSDNFQMGAGARLRAVQSQEMVDNEQATFTTNGLESVLVNLRYSLPMKDSWQYSFEANYRHSLYKNPSYNPLVAREGVVIGEGGTDVSLGMGITYISAAQNYLSGRFLYRNPAEHLSSEIFSEIEGAMVWKSIALIAGIENVYSLSQDPYTNDPENKPAISNGSTYLYNSINRSWTAPYAGLNFTLGEKWRVEVKATSRLYGVSTDLGNFYTISLVKRNSKPQLFKQKDAAFKEYQHEGVVTKITPSRAAVVIDMGLKKGLEKGSKVDFYHFDYLGGNQLIASGVVVKVNLGSAVVKILNRYSKLRVEEGTVARSGLIKE